MWASCKTMTAHRCVSRKSSSYLNLYLASHSQISIFECCHDNSSMNTCQHHTPEQVDNEIMSRQQQLVKTSKSNNISTTTLTICLVQHIMAMQTAAMHIVDFEHCKRSPPPPFCRVIALMRPSVFLHHHRIPSFLTSCASPFCLCCHLSFCQGMYQKCWSSPLQSQRCGALRPYDAGNNKEETNRTTNKPKAPPVERRHKTPTREDAHSNKQL